jgi:RNA polymerase sigma-70 factor (ECF subfamily)
VLDAARAGDRQALEILLVGHYDQVHALCRRMLGNESDAIDATQDALLSVVRSITRFDGRSSFGTWIYRIATNACLDELRRRRRRPLVGLPHEVDDDWDPGGEPAFGGRGRDPADEATAHVDLDAALRTMASEHRVALVLRDVCDLTYDEIAVVLDLPIGTVRSRIARGRAALADLMTGGQETGDIEARDRGTADREAGDRGTAGREAGRSGGDVSGNPSGGPVVKRGKRTENRTP